MTFTVTLVLDADLEGRDLIELGRTLRYAEDGCAGAITTNRQAADEVGHLVAGCGTAALLDRSGVEFVIDSVGTVVTGR